LIGLGAFWFLTFLLIPIPTGEALRVWLEPVLIWVFTITVFTGASTILLSILIIGLIRRIEAHEKSFRKQQIPLPPEFKTE